MIRSATVLLMLTILFQSLMAQRKKIYHDLITELGKKKTNLLVFKGFSKGQRSICSVLLTFLKLAIQNNNFMQINKSNTECCTVSNHQV